MLLKDSWPRLIGEDGALPRLKAEGLTISPSRSSNRLQMIGPSSANRPDDRTIGAGTDWLAQFSVAARELAASHERFRSCTKLQNESRLAGSSISLDPARDRFLHSEVASAPLSPLEIRSGFVLVGFTAFLLSVALTAVVVITPLRHTEKTSQPALGRGIERGSWSGPLPPATLAMRDDLSLLRLLHCLDRL